MKRHFVLLGALLLSGGLAGSQAFASPEPQAITQSSHTVTGTLVDEKGEPIIYEHGTDKKGKPLTWVVEQVVYNLGKVLAYKPKGL